MAPNRAARWVLVLGLTASSRTAHGDPPGVPPHRPTGSVEIGVEHQALTAGYSSWDGRYLRTVLQSDPRNVWRGELVRSREFDDRGTYFSVGNTHVLNADWYTHFTVGSSSGGFYLPRFRADAFVNRKWGQRRDLVTSLGIGYYRAKDAHRDHSLSLGAVYYPSPGWVVEGGVRWNRSAPGSVTSRSQFIAATQGREKQHYLILRLGVGREAYQLIGPAAALVDFPSREISLTWRQWVNRDWGFSISGGHYRNSSYRRTGVSVGSFKTF